MLQKKSQWNERAEEVHKLGFTRVKSALDVAEVRRLRAFCEEVHHRTGEDWMDPQTLFDAPELRLLPFRSASVQLMRDVLGTEFYVMPDFAVNLGKYGSWHRDTGSQILDGWKYVFDRDFLHMTFGLYFQENHPVFGGGLDVLPRSHRRVLPLQSTKLENVRDKLRLRLGRRHPIPCQPGDMLAFNFRIFHRATLPEQPRPANMPLRVAFFWGAVKERRHAEAYLQHLRDRAKTDPYFARLLPGGKFEYSADMRAAAAEAGCTLLSV
ncbi:MAG: hypothetical protein V4527_14605 [Pseudomonadota bacterium]